MPERYKMLEGDKSKAKDKTEELMKLDSDRVKTERKAWEEAGLVYPDTFYNEKERTFEYYRRLNPSSYRIAIDIVWRVLDERDGQEFIMYHAYRYCDQRVTSPDGKTVTKPWNIDGYYGFYHTPITQPLEFNPDGSVAKMDVIRVDKVYTIPWSKENFDNLIDDPINKNKTWQFYLGIVSTDQSRDVPIEGTTQQILNREDFSSYDFETTMQLGRSKLSGAAPTMGEIANILRIRNELVGKVANPSPASNNSQTIKAEEERSNHVKTDSKAKA